MVLSQSVMSIIRLISTFLAAEVYDNDRSSLQLLLRQSADYTAGPGMNSRSDEMSPFRPPATVTLQLIDNIIST